MHLLFSRPLLTMSCMKYYCRLIRSYSSVASPLTRLTSIKTFYGPLHQTLLLADWSACFPLPLCFLNQIPLFSLFEVDALDTGVGALLFQRSTSDWKLHPCAFFSCRQREILMLGTVSSWRSCWLSRSGGIGWRVSSFLLLPGLTIKTYPTSGLPAGWILAKPGGLCSWGI